MLIEKRSNARLKVDISAKYTFLNPNGSGHQARPCKLENISLGGMSVIADQSFITGDAVELEFVLPEQKNGDNKNTQGETSVKAHLDVVHTYGKQSGCRFFMIHKNTHDRIKKIIESKCLT